MLCLSWSYQGLEWWYYSFLISSGMSFPSYLRILIAFYPGLSHRKLYLYSVHLILCPSPSCGAASWGHWWPFLLWDCFPPYFCYYLKVTLFFFFSDISNTLSVENFIVPLAAQRTLCFSLRWQIFSLRVLCYVNLPLSHLEVGFQFSLLYFSVYSMLFVPS